jgi:quercetin dioxygenase-like cupin family protein
MAAITAVFDIPGMTSKQYDQTIKDLEAAGAGAPKGRLYHVANSKAGGWFVVDVWESEELLGAFAQTLMPILQKNGVNTSTRFLIKIVLVLFALVLTTSTTLAQDVVKVAPNNCKVLLENDRVRVVEIWIKPGEKLAMHSHPASVTYVLTAAKLKTTLPDGKTVDTEAPAGQALWSDGGSHEQVNVGKTEARALVVEMKTPAKLPGKKK